MVRTRAFPGGRSIKSRRSSAISQLRGCEVIWKGRYVGERFSKTGNLDPTPSFVVWNLSASYDVTKQVQAYVRFDNLFNEKYEEILFFGTPIRSIFGGVRINYDLPL